MLSNAQPALPPGSAQEWPPCLCMPIRHEMGLMSGSVGCRATVVLGIDDLPGCVLQLIAQHVTCFPQRCALPASRALYTHAT